MRRRDFIKAIARLATAWPLAAHAQHSTKIYRVGWIYSSVPVSLMAGFEPVDAVGRAFVRGLHDLGYVEGENLVLERRSAEGHFERIDEIATELVSREPDVILTGSGDFLAQIAFWHKADILIMGANVRFRGKSGH